MNQIEPDIAGVCLFFLGIIVGLLVALAIDLVAEIEQRSARREVEA